MILRSTIVILVFLLSMFTNLEVIQAQPVNFHHLTVKNGLNDPLVNAMVRDKYGYLWFASLGGLNRFNGTSIRRFTNVTGDSTTPFSSVPYTITCDKNGRLWIGYIHGMLEYDYISSGFRRVHAMNETNIYAMSPDDYGKIMMVTDKGLLYYDPTHNKFEEKINRGDTLADRLMNKTRVFDVKYRNGKFLIGIVNGVIEYEPRSKATRLYSLPIIGGSADKVMADADGNIWITNYRNYKLIKYIVAEQKALILDHLLQVEPRNQLSSASDFCADSINTWIITSAKGVMQYNNRTGEVNYHQHSNRLPNSIAAGLLRAIYMSPDGTIWINTPTGVDYFHPNKNYFDVIFPFADENEFNYGRGMTEDAAGNFWFTTAGGVTKYDPVRNTYQGWRNEPGKKEVIYYNSVRGVVEGEKGIIWIATGRGINRYNDNTGKMEFLSWPDSIPPSFYFSANRDNENRLWFGTRDYDGFYWYDPRTKKISGFGSHPILKEFKGRGGRFVMQDSRNRYWFGFNGNGLLMFDPNTNQTKHWFNDGQLTDSTITGNLVIDIKEDKEGTIWVSSFGGLSGINIDRKRYYHFHDKNGLTSNHVGPIAIDGLNRVWIGTANGLMLLDSNRKNFTYFNEEDGLPSLNFSEHPAHYTRDGRVMMPTTNGFIRFDPMQIRPEKDTFNLFIAGIEVFDKQVNKNFNNPEDARLSLDYDENFFTVHFEALNYLSSGKVWYAYRLEGFDKDWKYTQDPKAVYTNVPGGSYQLRYKATTDYNNWNVPEKALEIEIGTVFYKTWWFFSLLVILVVSTLYWIYRSRLSNQAQVHRLQSRAQLLEKEKTLVMYESLKQQLNPHFLFNSLTSLSGLIETDQKMAGNFLEQMSKIYRYILKNRDSEVVTLREEINFVQVYINLQKTRFKDGLQVFIDINPEDAHRKIAPVTLQNLIENAIKHNIIDVESPLRIDIFTENDYLVVRNNLQKKNVVETSNKQGLINLESLYQYLSSKPLIIEEDEKLFTIKVPLI